MLSSPKLWWRSALLAAVGVHLVAIASLALPALPALRGQAGLITALPTLRTVLAVLGLVALIGVAVLAVKRRVSVPSSVAGVLVLGAALAGGLLYGCSRQTQVVARPARVLEEGGQKRFDHGQLDLVLARFVDEHGMVDYPALLAQRRLLDEYVGQLASTSPRSNPELFPSADDRVAYWLNAYNALALRAVIDHYPIGSVSEIMVAHGVFSRLYFPVGGTPMTLDDIEKGVLLAELDDPRVHFALTCASMSCPRLDRDAFRAEGLSERLDREGRNFLNSADGVQLDAAARELRLSSYFKWYGGDFGDDHVAFVARFLAPERRAVLESMREPRTTYLDYDWRLNDATASWHAR